MKKKGQLTVFVIVGMVILFSVGIYLYIRSETTLFQPKELVPKELTPVKEFVEQCMNSLTSDAVFLASSQGGYVDLPLDIAADPSRHVGYGLKIPLWYTPGDMRMPSQAEMQKQIGDHVLSNLGSCVNNFQQFSQQYNITPLAAPQANVTISDNAVTVQLDYPLDVRNKQNTQISRISKFSTSIDDTLGKKYRLARQIFVYEQQHAFLENLTLEMIAGSGLPYQGMEITCAKREWDVENDIKPTIKLMLLANLRFLTFTNTASVQPQSPYPDYYRAFYTIRPSAETFGSMLVTTVFNTQWPIDVNVYPNSNGKVTPVTADLPAIGSCFKIYDHKYDVVYPLVFQITDTSKDTPSYFYFATDVVLDRNVPNRQAGLTPRYETDTITTSDYCNDRKYPLSVYAIDDFTNERISGASINFRCIRFSCDMGQTSVRRTAEGYVLDPSDFVLAGNFPGCAGGIITASKDGYLDGEQTDVLTGDITKDGVNQIYQGMTYNIRMIPLKPFDIDVKEVVYSASGLSHQISEIEPDEIAIISLRSDEKQYNQLIQYPISPDNPDTIKLLLADGIKYHVSVNLVKGDSLVGGSQLDWVVESSGGVYRSSRLTFYAIKSSTVPSTDQEYSGLAQLISDKSTSFPPELSAAAPAGGGG
jgi:hypothetical protein